MIKKLLFAVFIVAAAFSNAGAQYKWSKIEYFAYSGPVSPPYQWHSVVTIYSDGTGSFFYSHGKDELSNNFTLTKENLDSIDEALNKTNIFNLSSKDMEAENFKIGGPEYYASIILPQLDPNSDAAPERIEIPAQVKSIYEKNIRELYSLIVRLTPAYPQKSD